jgi:hypothetical protein
VKGALAVAIAVTACNQHEPAHRHPNAAAAADRCAHLYNQLDDIEPEQRQQAIATACADVVVEKRCHDELLAFDTPPDQRIAKLLDACTAAYCPILPDPKPARCTDPNGDGAGFWHAVHLFDLGPEATKILDDAKPAPVALPAKGPALPSPEDVTWRVPIIATTKDAITLSWRAPDGKDTVALTTPVASFDCTKLREQLVLEVMHTWRDTVRPTRSKQLLLSAASDAPDKVVFDIMSCVNDRSGPRQLYPDVTLSVQR